MGDLKRLLAMSRSHHSHIATLRGLAAKRTGKPMETKGDGGGGSAFTDAAELTLLRAKLAVQKSWEGERAELEQELKRKQEECLKLAAHNAQLQETARQVYELVHAFPCDTVRRNVVSCAKCGLVHASSAFSIPDDSGLHTGRGRSRAAASAAGHC